MKRILKSMDLPSTWFLYAFVLAIVVFFIVALANTDYPITDDNEIPHSNITSRSVENTGGFGRAEYFLFDSDGYRYMVSQEIYDTYYHLGQ